MLAHGSRALLNGFWLGVLSSEALRAVDERYYDQAASYRTPDWNERGLFPWERDLITAHFGEGSRVAVLSAGGGREVLALLLEGYEAVGYEPHPALVSYAEAFLAERGHPSRVRPVARDEFPGDPGKVDGVVVGWGGFPLMRGRERRISLLHDAHHHLPPGGPVLLSFFERLGGRELLVTARIANAIRSLLGRPPVELGDTLAPNPVHVFNRQTFVEEIAAAGFEVAEYRVIGPADEATSYAAAVIRAHGEA